MYRTNQRRERNICRSGKDADDECGLECYLGGSSRGNGKNPQEGVYLLVTGGKAGEPGLQPPPDYQLEEQGSDPDAGRVFG